VDADRGAIVTRANLRRGERCVALIAERLALIGADFYFAILIEHFRQGQLRDRDVTQFAAIEESEGGAIDFLLRAGRLFFSGGGFLQRQAFVVNLVAA
jgi:hypothetical protein